ncbi:hypothetical protein HPB51_026146 [Rhipicephalus microplus]|uniref:Uncharacterized protein n=1 Tax=Rhipicephalus microplus TaxID=6941 RepID=A0A9J6EJC8_RHIMP|nr:hypothetical protein HPB51_026146 [Rhipicephalus microplus]
MRDTGGAFPRARSQLWRYYTGSRRKGSGGNDGVAGGRGGDPSPGRALRPRSDDAIGRIDQSPALRVKPPHLSRNPATVRPRHRHRPARCIERATHLCPPLAPLFPGFRRGRRRAATDCRSATRAHTSSLGVQSCELSRIPVLKEKPPPKKSSKKDHIRKDRDPREANQQRRPLVGKGPRRSPDKCRAATTSMTTTKATTRSFAVRPSTRSTLAPAARCCEEKASDSREVEMQNKTIAAPSGWRSTCVAPPQLRNNGQSGEEARVARARSTQSEPCTRDCCARRAWSERLAAKQKRPAINTRRQDEATTRRAEHARRFSAGAAPSDIPRNVHYKRLGRSFNQGPTTTQAFLSPFC